MKRKFDRILRDVMSKRKVKHSLRVFDKFKKYPKYVRYGALFHDYLERGGDIKVLESILDPKSIALVKMLTLGSEDDLIPHMDSVLCKTDDEELKNFLILIKLVDRKDNYTKRVRTNTLTKKYKKKTKDLVRFLTSRYTGDLKLIKNIL